MRAHLFHGFNVTDGGRGSVGNLIPHLEAVGIEPILHGYGWTGPVRLRLVNRRVVRDLVDHIEPGDVLIGHSNGFLICRKLVHAVGHNIRAVVGIQPCVRRDLWWANSVSVLCLYNPHDLAVQFGRAWGRLSTLWTPWAPHGWGAAGRYGFTLGERNVTNWDTSASYWRHPARGHTAVLRPPAVEYWGALMAQWLREQVNAVPEPDR